MACIDADRLRARVEPGTRGLVVAVSRGGCERLPTGGTTRARALPVRNARAGDWESGAVGDLRLQRFALHRRPLTRTGAKRAVSRLRRAASAKVAAYPVFLAEVEVKCRSDHCTRVRRRRSIATGRCGRLLARPGRDRSRFASSLRSNW